MRTREVAMVAALLLTAAGAAAQDAANSTNAVQKDVVKTAAANPDIPLVNVVDFGVRGTSFGEGSDQARYQPLGRKAMLRRIGLRGLDPALFERPKSGFVLPFDRWIRRGLKDAMDQTLRDPQAIAPAGLDPAAVERLWRAFLDGAPGMYWSRVWSVYVFIRWCHRNRVFR